MFFNDNRKKLCYTDARIFRRYDNEAFIPPGQRAHDPDDPDHGLYFPESVFCFELFAGLTLALMVPVGMLSLLFPMLSRFEDSLAALLRNTVLLSLANLPRTLALGILNAMVTLLCARFVIPLFIVPAMAAYIATWLIEPMFKLYMPEEEAAQ